ncbi:hypothetical protein L226DRAFT_549593 [Lentinus tigrinus ALCF2SS1-7]|uniref:Uncharacterized protein n=1 Tax=Lentinus tigrinus ALCF2SS1-6 TaxID=1328759 RepID=A0A5C2STS5_9APHY|nr:hypothetical protein L227DRAFT_648033 [Lentinus tigrinus ALCF2SS1-6]RPD80810.1 hypothetical protein L226DRAFT_549593 [Lentinus tigrinus ALCF2SS1-7]
MSAATVSEPFLLSSYPESSAYKKRRATPLYVSLPSGSDADPFVTIAVQGDGVHILDTSTLHPAASHTLGPSTSFSCPPATRTSPAKGGVRTCTTYAILESGPDMQPEGKGKTVLAWEESLAGGMSTSTESDKKKRVAVAPHPVAHIHAPDYLPSHVVLVSATGEVSVADAELEVQRTCTPQNNQPSTLVKHFLFPAASCSFLPSYTTSSYRAVSVSFLRSGDVLRVSVVGVAEENVTYLGECVVPTEETEILDLSCSDAGFISILVPSGSWIALSLTTSPSSSLTVSEAAEPLRLQGLTFINAARASEVSLAALTSSHVLLSAVTTGSVPEIVLLLWDLRYGVLLAQQTISVPSTLPRPKKQGAMLRLVASSTTRSTSSAFSKASAVNLNIILVLLPSPDRDHQQAETGNAARSTVLVVPLTVPVIATIAAAMGKANAGARWVSMKSGRGQAQPARCAPEMSTAARKALAEMKTAVDGSANGSTIRAETVFFEYVQQQGKGKGAAQGEEQSTPLEYPFVQGVLELVLHAPANTQGSSAHGKTQSAGAYSAKILRHLLESRTVSSSMVEGGVLPALAARNDWDAVALAMRTVSDLPEADVMALLTQVVAAHHRTSVSDENAMDVDSAPASASTPTLPMFLAQCVVYPYTPALQRTALHKHLADAADLTVILEVLDKWIVQHTEGDALLSATPPVTEASEPPPLDKVLAFVQTLLDASFLALLAHTPAHRLLRTLAGHIQPALARASELELLCGPLEPFARAAAAKAKAQAEAKDGGAKANDSGKDWRRKRKMAHEQAGMAVGLYQVEELVL